MLMLFRETFFHLFICFYRLDQEKRCCDYQTRYNSGSPSGFTEYSLFVDLVFGFYWLVSPGFETCSGVTLCTFLWLCNFFEDAYRVANVLRCMSTSCDDIHLPDV
jgi:hypothetical protein